MTDETRRGLLAKTGLVAAGVVAAATVGCDSGGDKPDDEVRKKNEKNEKHEPEKADLVGACGLACETCPLMKAGKCKGCASGKAATPELLKMKPCPVLKCAAMKKIDYCGTACKMFTTCAKLVGKPYDKTFMDMIAKRLA